MLVRFSDFTGIPDIPDTIGEANPRGFALKFTLPDGSIAGCGDPQLQRLPDRHRGGVPRAAAGDRGQRPGRGQAHGAGHFLGGHPIAKTFLTTQKPAPESFTTLSYFGVNAFDFTAAKGARSFVRYRFVPGGGEAPCRRRAEDQGAELPAGGAAAAAGQGAGGVRLVRPDRRSRGDRIDDPSIAWPESRRLVKLGTCASTASRPTRRRPTRRRCSRR